MNEEDETPFFNNGNDSVVIVKEEGEISDEDEGTVEEEEGDFNVDDAEMEKCKYLHCYLFSSQVGPI